MCVRKLRRSRFAASKHQRLILQCFSNKLPPCAICQRIDGGTYVKDAFMLFSKEYKIVMVGLDNVVKQ
ncbi:hypothetical protein ACS0TY_010837 [Phlomoides rotata]